MHYKKLIAKIEINKFNYNYQILQSKKTRQYYKK